MEENVNTIQQTIIYGGADLLDELLNSDLKNYVNWQDEYGQTFLHMACKLPGNPCVQVLINARADVNCCSFERVGGKTPLHLSAHVNDLQACKLLVEHGADLYAQDANGYTPIQCAQINACKETSAYLLDEIEKRRLKMIELQAALVAACQIKDLHLVDKILRDSKSSYIYGLAGEALPSGENLLSEACQAGFTDVAKLLVCHGAGAVISPVTFVSPLHMAVSSGHATTVKFLLTQFPELSKVATCSEKWLPIHAAANIGRLDLVKLLLEHPFPKYVLNSYKDDTGAYEYNMVFNLNAVDSDGRTALAIATKENHCNVVSYLLNFTVMARPICFEQAGGLVDCKPVHPVRSDVRDNDSYTPLQLAVLNDNLDMVNVLLENGADVRAPLASSKLSEHVALEECVDTSGALLIACLRNNHSMVDLLLDKGCADVSNKAVHLCFASGHVQLATRLLSRLAFVDPEYRMNKRAVDKSCVSFAGQAGSLLPSALYPSKPTMINWHQANLKELKECWLRQAVCQVNSRWKVAGSVDVSRFATFAITRIDLSKNNLTNLPAFLFAMPSLRILNASQNSIVSVSVENRQRGDGSMSMLEEVHLDKNCLTKVPAALFTLPALVTLNLASNCLEELPCAVWNCAKLKELNVANNRLSSLPLPRPNDDPLARPCPFQSSGDEEAEGFGCAEEAADANLQAWKADDSICVHEVRHHSLWQRCPALIRADDEWSPSTGVPGKSHHLTTLNLSANRFQYVPQNLSCLAPGLLKLNMARNEIRDMGMVNAYPAGLRQLDLGGNRIKRWFVILHYSPTATRKARSPSRSSAHGQRSRSVSRFGRLSTGSTGDRSELAVNLCAHRRHARLENLKTLILADNCLDDIQLGGECFDLAPEQCEDGRRRSASTHRNRRKVAAARDKENADQPRPVDLVAQTRQRITFPNLSMLDLSRNYITTVPAGVAALHSLAVLNLSGNAKLCSLPAELGLLSKLWNLNLANCNLAEPLSTLFNSDKCKTVDIVGYLKSILEDSKRYAKLKLMIVGVQGIGKTSLLKQIRLEGSVPKRVKPDGWASRMGTAGAGNQKTACGKTISTVGVDVNEWVYQPKRHRDRCRVPITFRTWDFGGQREYYATHQYFLSKRSIYLVVWRLTDGEAGISELAGWLINIQARAPNSPVIIVGTHVDAVKSNSKMFPADYVQSLQSVIRERFINISDPEKRGMPNVVDSLAVSCVTKENVRTLCERIYATAAELRLPPGSKEPLIDQRVPSAYTALEDIVLDLAAEREAHGQEPVMTADLFKSTVQKQMKRRFGRFFRDARELSQAVVFLHENGVMLHYDDATLKNLYFLDPQWLCDTLAHVITIREINPFAKGGLMRVDNLKILFKAAKFKAANVRNYALSLLQKFEVALTWDNQTLLIPSLLPDEYQLRAGYPGCDVRIPVSRKQLAKLPRPNRTLRQTDKLIMAKPGEHEPPDDGKVSFTSVHVADDRRCVRRLYAMLYFPCGFWSRFITRMLGDEKVHEHFQAYFKVTGENEAARRMGTKVLFDKVQLHWSLWQTGMEVNFLDGTLMCFKQFLPLAQVRDVDYRLVDISYRHEAAWSSVKMDQWCLLEIYMPQLTFHLTIANDQDHGEQSKAKWTLESDRRAMSQLLTSAVDILDTLLEDWYPSLGTRFMHTSEGRYLVTRLVPCPYCILDAEKLRILEDTWTVLMTNNIDGGVEEEEEEEAGGKQTESASQLFILYSFTVEECILASNDSSAVSCPTHGALSLNSVAPDVVFVDLNDQRLILTDSIKRGKLLGHGAFGFVFKASVRLGHSGEMQEVAFKMLQPVDPGFGARASAVAAYRAAYTKWKRDPVQSACRAYCTARQELNVLLKLKHNNIVPLIGLCAHPLSLVFGLAPLGSLGALLRNYKRSGALLNWTVVQETASQVAKALEYLHQMHVVYRDLKSENVLVWQFPPPFSQLTGVQVKLGDYGISRSALPTGNMKGFGGTEGFMAPEIILYNGEEEYTERVDCFSFGMFLYEMYTFKLPFEGQEQVKEYILDGGRPTLLPKETLYPLNFLDVMIKCWSQLSSDRPSSSHLVSLTAAPEFAHLLDVVSLEEAESSVVAAEAFFVEENNALEDVSIADAELWLSRTDGTVSVLSSDGYSWYEYKSVQIGDDSIVTAMCLIGEQIWLAEISGVVRIFCVKMYEEIFNFELGATVLAAPDWQANKERRLQVDRVVHLDKFDQVLIMICDRPAAVVVCQANLPSDCQPIIRWHVCQDCQLLSSTVFPSSGGGYELWTCDSNALLRTFQIGQTFLSAKETAQHLATTPEADEEIESALLASSAVSDLYIWSYINPGTVVYQWNVSSKCIKAKLDCSKIMPCSESLNSMSIEEGVDSRFCQVSAMHLLERDDSTQLYVGTRMGVVIVAEADQLRPITAFRPHCQDVRVIAAFNPTRRAILHDQISKQSSSLDSERSRKSHNRNENPGSVKSIESALSKSPQDTGAICSSTFVITVGKGYRSLIDRFTECGVKSEPSTTVQDGDIYSILWRTEDW